MIFYIGMGCTMCMAARPLKIEITPGIVKPFKVVNGSLSFSGPFFKERLCIRQLGKLWDLL